MGNKVLRSKASTRTCDLSADAIRLVAVLLLFLALAVAVSPAQDPAAVPRPTTNPANPKDLPTPTPIAFRLDHFLCYVVEPAQFQPRPGLSLIDQFNPKPRPFVLTERQWLCNPVSKNGEAMHNPRGHLTGYVMKEPTTPPLNIPVTVVNQFGTQRLVVGQPSRFFVPTGKLLAGQPATNVPPPPPIPTGLDHYACYVVRPEGTVPHPGVVLSDQFGRLQAEVVEPMLLCNPAEKLIDNKPTGHIINPRDHLACYVIKAGGFQPRKVAIHNQFESTGVEAVRPELLCLPSIKEVLKVLPGAVKEPVKP